MVLRELKKEEHMQTRALYEAVFTEDSKAFLDYYYMYKTKNNIIYGIEDEGQLCAMLHLNPYDMQVFENVIQTHYIVAVATLPIYRKQGLMRRVLVASMQALYEKEEAFTFLMPAREEIYLPYDFRFIYSQRQGEGTGNDVATSLMMVHQGEAVHLVQAASFANAFLKKRFHLYTKRNEAYYATLLQEAECEKGSLIALMDAERMVGLFSYVIGEKIEVREPMIMDAYKEQFFSILKELSVRFQKEYLIRGDILSENGIYKPMIMARIIHLPKVMSLVEATEDLELTLYVQDEWLSENNGYFRFFAKAKEAICVEVGEEAKSAGRMTIADLTSFLFGYLSIEELPATSIEMEGKEELGKLCLIKPSFINEIV